MFSSCENTWEGTSIYSLEVGTKNKLILWPIMMSQSIGTKLKNKRKEKIFIRYHSLRYCPNQLGHIF